MRDILEKLVEIPSTTGNHMAAQQLLDYIEQFVTQRGMHVNRHEFNGYESLVATTRVTKTPAVFLAAHGDIVPTKGSYKLRETDDRYYGCGVFDMKCAIAAYLGMIDELGETVMNYDFGLMITTDEEHAGSDGTNALLTAGYGAGITLLPDAGDTPDGWKIERSAKGAWLIDIATTGKTAHGSRPWKGENAIDKLIRLIDDMKLLFPNQGPTTNTMTLVKILGGEGVRQVPDQAMARLDLRVLSDEEKERLEGELRQLCGKYSAELSEVHQYIFARPAEESTKHLDDFAALIRKVDPEANISIEDSFGASDARYFSHAGLQCIVATCQGDGYHTEDEWVSKTGLDQLKQVCHELIRTTNVEAVLTETKQLAAAE